MNVKKAFTLVEMIAVIIILSLIATLAFPAILKQINSTKGEISGSMEKIIYAAGSLYASENSLPKIDGYIYCVTLQSLVDGGYLNSDLKDPVTQEDINKTKFVKMLVSNSNYDYEFVDSCNGRNAEVSPSANFTVAGGTFNVNGWANSNFNVVINITDPDSTPTSYKYCVGTSKCDPTILVNAITGFAQVSTESETNYVCIIGYDDDGNDSITICSDPYKLDKTNPTIVAKNASYNVASGASNVIVDYFTVGNTGLSSISGTSCVDTSNSNAVVNNTSTLSVGTHNITCTTTKANGLTASANTSIVINIPVYTFDYTGTIQSVTLAAGTYKLEVWGASGGDQTSGDTYGIGGYGGYSVGTYTASTGTTVYIVVGGKGIAASLAGGGYNGGGNASSYVASSGSGTYYSGGGGGATHIATQTGLLSALSSNLSSVLTVAGGGGGGGMRYCNGCSGNSPNGGSAGGFTGVSSTGSSTNNGGTQSSGNAFGLGQSNARTFCSYGSAGGGGGGGLYGGYANNYAGCGTGEISAGGGGGSSYIGGVTTNATYSVTRAMYCYNCTTSAVESTLTNTTTNVSATPTANYTKTGNGYAKITYLGN